MLPGRLLVAVKPSDRRAPAQSCRHGGGASEFLPRHNCEPVAIGPGVQTAASALGLANSRIGVVAGLSGGEERARCAFVPGDQDLPPTVRLSFWQLFSAARNAGEFGLIPLEGLIFMPCEVGSGKFGTPCARMHRE